jgi:hypothetical protein
MLRSKVQPNIRNAVADQQSMSDEYKQSLVGLAIKSKSEGISGISVADFVVFARPVHDSLGISPSSVDIEAIGSSLLVYLPIIQGDMGAARGYVLLTTHRLEQRRLPYRCRRDERLGVIY